MKLPRVRISVRCLMILVAVMAVSVAGGRRLIVGDGGVTVELFNSWKRLLRWLSFHGTLPGR